MEKSPVRYQSDEEDSGRWSGFPFRAGDIVISTRSKSGTTWVQMICALLIFQTPELPGAARRCRPGWTGLMRAARGGLARLAAQPHRRFIKSHTPLDGIPIDPRATYIVVARHPLDMAVSALPPGQQHRPGAVAAAHRPAGAEPSRRRPRPPLHDWLLSWIHEDADPRSSRWTRCPA